MPVLSPAAVRKQISARNLDPIYLIVGDDEVEMSKLAGELSSLIEDELRAFNLERLYASDKGVTPSSIVGAARTLPMLGDRRVVVVLRAERLLKPKRRGARTVEAPEGSDRTEEDVEPPSDLDVLEAYVRRPEALSTLILVASDVDRQRKIYKALMKHASIVECWGLQVVVGGRLDTQAAARNAGERAGAAAAAAGKQIEPPALKLLVSRAGSDIARLRGDVDRLILFVGDRQKITLADAREVVSGETSQDDWAVTNAIGRADAAEALRQLGLALDAGGVSYQILGQLAWYVRERLATADPRRVPAAVEALFRTDLELKSSTGEPRVLLERLVVDLCRR